MPEDNGATTLKIPLEMFINILEDLYNGGADYVDISGDTDTDGTPRDTIKSTVTRVSIY